MGSIPPKWCRWRSGIERLADEIPLAEDCINPVSASSASSARDLRLRSLFHMKIRNEGRQSRTGVRTKRAPPAAGATRDVSAQLAFKVGIAIRDQAEVVLRGAAGKNAPLLTEIDEAKGTADPPEKLAVGLTQLAGIGKRFQGHKEEAGRRMPARL